VVSISGHIFNGLMLFCAVHWRLAAAVMTHSEQFGDHWAFLAKLSCTLSFSTVKTTVKRQAAMNTARM